MCLNSGLKLYQTWNISKHTLKLLKCLTEMFGFPLSPNSSNNNNKKIVKYGDLFPLLLGVLFLEALPN